MKSKKNKYKHILSEEDFTEITAPKKMHHFDLPAEAIKDDENENSVRETLAGMEYDNEVHELLDEEDFFNDNIPDEDDEYLQAEEDNEALKHEASP